MSKVAIVTDSNAGLKNSSDENLFIVPMPFLINDEEFFEDINLTTSQFYDKLKENADIHTSQPSYSEVTDLWKKVLTDFDELVYIPMTSGLSSSCASAISFAENEFANKVFVVDNQRISVTQKLSVFEALELANQGKSAAEIKDYLEKTKMDATIYIMVPTLKYLKKGGRVTPAAAALAKLFNIKPILQIHGEKLDSFAKVINLSQAKQKMINAVKHDLETFLKEPHAGGKLCINVAHTQNEAEALKFAEEVKRAFPDLEFKFVDPLSLSVSCHIGPGSLAIAVCRCKE